MAITKRYRLVIDYEVEVSDFEPSGWHEPEDYEDFGTPGFNEWAENQRRLFDAVMKDPKRVEQMCQRSLLDALETDYGDLRRLFSIVPTEDALYAETFTEMSQQDREYWENICSEHLFFENADFVVYRFQPFIQSCTMQNVDTGELIEGQPHEPTDGEAIFHGVESFGTWAGPLEEQHGPRVERYEPSAKRLEKMRKQVSLAGEVPERIKEFLQLFAIHRTIFTHVNPETPDTVCSDDYIIREANEWVATNPVFTKQDLSCLKGVLRKVGFPKLLRHNLIQDMRGKTFQDLCRVSSKNGFLS